MDQTGKQVTFGINPSPEQLRILQEMREMQDRAAKPFGSAGIGEGDVKVANPTESSIHETLLIAHGRLSVLRAGLLDTAAFLNGPLTLDLSREASSETPIGENIAQLCRNIEALTNECLEHAARIQKALR